MTVRTASGGLHYIFRMPFGMEARGGNNKFGPGVDVKAHGGYVVGAGSMISQGKADIGVRYVVEGEGPNGEWPKIAEAPQWLIDECKQARPKDKQAGERIADETPEAVQQAWRQMETWPAGDDPDAGDEAAYRHAAQLADLGLEQGTTAEIVHTWNETLDHPMNAERLEQKVENAYLYRQNPIGNRSPDTEGFEPLDETPVAPYAKSGGLKLLSLAEAAAMALEMNAEPLIEDLLVINALSVIYGESSQGKTFVAMDLDYHIAAGLPWAGREVKQGAVVYLAAEGGAGVYKRLAVLAKAHGKAEVPFYVIPGALDLLHGSEGRNELIAKVKQAAEKAGIPVVKITVDTLSRAIAGGDENSSVDMGKFVKQCDAIREATGAHLTIIHHSGKDAAKGARGWSGVRGASDTEIEVKDKKILVRKMRDGDDNQSFGFELCTDDIDKDKRGKLVTSCYIEVLTSQQVQEKEARAKAKKERDDDDRLIEAMQKKSFKAGEAAMWLREKAGRELKAGKAPGTSDEPMLKATREKLEILVAKGRLTVARGTPGAPDLYTKTEDNPPGVFEHPLSTCCDYVFAAFRGGCAGWGGRM
jgi:hypothetical protein